MEDMEGSATRQIAVARRIVTGRDGERNVVLVGHDGTCQLAETVGVLFGVEVCRAEKRWIVCQRCVAIEGKIRTWAENDRTEDCGGNCSVQPCGVPQCCGECGETRELSPSKAEELPNETNRWKYTYWAVSILSKSDVHIAHKP